MNFEAMAGVARCGAAAGACESGVTDSVTLTDALAEATTGAGFDTLAGGRFVDTAAIVFTGAGAGGDAVASVCGRPCVSGDGGDTFAV